jgi:hypothetical protein
MLKKIYLLNEALNSAKEGVFKRPDTGYAPKDTFATPSPWGVLDISGMLYSKKKVIFEKLSGDTLLTLTLTLTLTLKSRVGLRPRDTFATRYPRADLDVSGNVMLYQQKTFSISFPGTPY